MFLKEVIPDVEKRLGPPKYRVVFGESMGGLNALIVGLSNNALFNKVISLCPGIYNGSPFASIGDIFRFIKRTGAEPRVLLGVLMLARQYVSDEESWKAISPIDLLDHASPLSSPEIYLNVGLYDVYGNFEGAELFAKKAIQKGFKVQWRPSYGGHCSIDIHSVAEELSR